METDLANNLSALLLDAPSSHEEQVQKLVEMGFKSKECAKLLSRSGEFETVRQYLEAKAKLRIALKCKRTNFKKESRKKSKGDSKELKKMKKLERKAQKLGRHAEKRLTRSNAPTVVPSINWKEVKFVVLDAANIMFANFPLVRQEMLKGNRQAALIELKNLALKFFRSDGVEFLLVIEDAPPTDKEEGITFFSSTPSFQTTDDALLSLAGEMKEKKGVFVTSDGILAFKMRKLGVVVGDGREWLSSVSQLDSPPTKPEDVVSESLKDIHLNE